MRLQLPRVLEIFGRLLEFSKRPAEHLGYGIPFFQICSCRSLEGEAATKSRVGKTRTSVENGCEIENSIVMTAEPTEDLFVKTNNAKDARQEAHICNALARSWMYSMQLGRSSTA